MLALPWLGAADLNRRLRGSSMGAEARELRRQHDHGAKVTVGMREDECLALVGLGDSHCSSRDTSSRGSMQARGGQGIIARPHSTFLC